VSSSAYYFKTIKTENRHFLKIMEGIKLDLYMTIEAHRFDRFKNFYHVLPFSEGGDF
jgi:hypothetical protein